MTTTRLALEAATFADLGPGPFRLALARNNRPIGSGTPYAVLVEGDAQPQGGTPQDLSAAATGHAFDSLPNGIWSGTDRLWVRGEGILIITPITTPVAEPLTTGQGTTDTTAALLLDARVSRSTKIQNNGTAPIFIGGPDVTTTTGKSIAPGVLLDLGDYSGQVYGVSAAAQPYDMLSY